VTTWTCFKVASLLERRGVGLSVSEGLLAESHLSECARCREQSRVLEGVRKLAVGSEDGVLTSLSREQQLKRAFEAAAVAAPASDFRPSAMSSRWAGAGAVLLVAAMIALWLGLAVPAKPAPGDSVEAGRIAAAGEQLLVGAPVPASVPLVSGANEARLRVGSAQVSLAAQSSVTWRAEHDTLELADGAIDVSVEHRPGHKFWVTTPDFRVEVVGTEFHVDGAGVRVTRGTVRVLSLGGDVLAVLPAGGAWSMPVAPVTAIATSEPAPALSATEPRAQLDTVEADKGHAASVEPVAQRLASARRALGGGQVAEAEKLAEGVLVGKASAREAAEARTLLADCAVSRGQLERAAQLYLGVARSFPGLPAGENALFSGARLTERVSGKARAQSAFEQYLRRYPHGRFRQEAERHLGSGTPR
jgi:hypothetical protein